MGSRITKDFLSKRNEWLQNNPLRILRERTGFSQAFIASLVNKGHHRVSDWENGNAFPDKEIVAKLGEALGSSRFKKDWDEWINKQPTL